MLQKILQFLEKTVEWFALGLGLLFLAYTAWAYLWNPPVTDTFRTFDNQSLIVLPGTADAQIRSKEAEPLEAEIHDPKVLEFHVENFGDIIDQNLSKMRTPSVLAENFDAPPGATTVSTAPQPLAESQIVNAIPTVPAASALGAYSGLSTIQMDPSKRNDFNWVTVAFAVDPAQLHQAWIASFGPIDERGNGKLTQQQMGTFFLNVKLYRSEQLGSGWSDDVEITRPSFNDTLNSYPAAGVEHRAEQMNYTMWASGNAPLIVAPPALPVTAGSPWTPAVSLFGGGVGTDGGSPAPAVAPPDTAPSTQPATAPSTEPSETGSVNPRRSNLALANAAFFYVERKTVFADLQAAPPPAGGAAGGAAMPPELSLDPVIVKSQFSPAIPPASPSGTFNPAAMDANAPGLLIYLNDLTALPGKTYRYKIVYQIHNPVFTLPPDHVSNKSWVEQMDLTSPASDYTPPITIKRHSLFFCDQARTSSPVQPFPFDVISWSDGAWRETIFRASPGDLIGDSGATFVSGAHESDTESTRIVSVDDTGVITVRNAAADSSSPQRKAVLDYLLHAGQAPPPAALPPGEPGGQPGGATGNL